MKNFLLISLLYLGWAQALFAQQTEPDVATPEGALEVFLKEDRDPPKSFPRRWLFMQEQGTAYGTPSPLVFDRMPFENYGWFQSADPEAVRLYFQMNPKLRDEDVEAEEIRKRLLTFMNITFSDALLLRNKDGSWSVNSRLGQELSEIGHFEKGPDSLRGDAPIRWLVEQLGYDAVVVGVDDNFLFLAKLRPVKRGAQGLIMKATTTSLILKDSKDVGALLRVVHEDSDYLVAKVSLAKSGRPKVPLGSKVLFSE